MYLNVFKICMKLPEGTRTVQYDIYKKSANVTVI